MTNTPLGAAADAARDPCYVYRPMLSLIGLPRGPTKGAATTGRWLMARSPAAM